MRYAWIEGPRKVYTLDEMCRVLALLRAIHAALKGAYGSPRMVRELRGPCQQGAG